MLYLLTCVQREKRVLHTEVRTYAFTCSEQDFFGGIIGHDIKPIRSDAVPKDLEITDVATPIALVMIQNVSLLEDELLFSCVPLFQRNMNRAFGNGRRFPIWRCLKNLIARLELRRAVFTPFFELRRSPRLPRLPFLIQAKKRW